MNMYIPTDPVPACVGAEHDEYWTLYLAIGEGLNVPLRLPKERMPNEFKSSGTMVWVSSAGPNNICIEPRIVGELP